jgi:ATP-dependent RNA helicase DeaD
MVLMSEVTPPESTPLKFTDLNLKPTLQSSIAAAGYVELTPIQEKIIPVALESRDVTGMAQTGTGKTAAFLIPILQMIEPSGEIQALVVTPTRELAIQVCGEGTKLSQGLNIKVAAVYGGTSIGHQRRELFNGVDIVVGTPGRLIDFIKTAVLRMRYLKWLVLDEADRMLDMGFIEDIDFLCKRAPLSRQTMLFSATLPPGVMNIARSYMMHPVEISVSPRKMVAERVRQTIYGVSENRKMPLLFKVLEAERPERCLIFTARRESTGEIMRKLRERGWEAARLSSLQEQRHREGIMDMFRRGEIHILVATDVAGRGIDIGDISHVINYDAPREADDYVHRIGRTARAGREGHAISFVTRDDMETLDAIRKYTGLELPVQSQDNGAVDAAFTEPRAEGQKSGRGRRRRGGRSSGAAVPVGAHAGQSGASAVAGGRRRGRRRGRSRRDGA